MKIYKFFSNYWITQLLNDLLLKFTPPKELNDPFEVRPHLLGLADSNTIHNELSKYMPNSLHKEYLENPEINQSISFSDFLTLANEKLPDVLSLTTTFVKSDFFINKFNNMFYEKFNENIGILSLTQELHNLLMWAHYAKSHQGFVAEFDEKHQFFNQSYDEEGFLGKLHKVEYQGNRPSQYFSQFNIRDVFLCKSEDWSYEREYRMLLPLQKASKIDNKKYLYQIDPKLIKAIYCGCNMNQQDRTHIINTITMHSNLSHIEIYQAKLSEKHYRLNFEKI